MRLERKRYSFTAKSDGVATELLTGLWKRIRIRRLQRCVCCFRVFGRDDMMWRPLDPSYTNAHATERVCDKCVGYNDLIPCG